MNIQSLSIVVPTKGCMNQCKFCVSRMHKEEYPNLISTNNYFHRDSYKNRIAFARDNGCNTVMLTGQGEPQQNIEFIADFARMNSELVMPFRNIEIQTTGARIDEYTLNCLRNCGVTTISLSVSCLNCDKVNSDIINGSHNPIDLAGRSMSRAKAFDSLKVDEFQKQMADAGIYTTTADEKTLDEAPDAYKPMDEIVKLIEPTVDIKYFMKPKMNIKAAEDRKKFS